MDRDDRNMLLVVTGTIIGLLFLSWLWCSFCSVPTGHIGVVTSFGRVEKETLDEGVAFISFWKRVNTMCLQLQEAYEEAQIPSKEGLNINISVSLLYVITKERAAEIFQTIGKDYEVTFVMAQFRSVLRGITVKYEAKDLYTANREKVEQEIFEAIKPILESRGFTAQYVRLRNLVLPQLVSQAIEQKLEAEQSAQKMKFVVDKERLEAERKAVEAGGIAEAQKIIQGTLTDNYLRYLWIEALKIAAANPSTVIYIPTGSDGLPIMLPILNDKQGK